MGTFENVTKPAFESYFNKLIKPWTAAWSEGYAILIDIPRANRNLKNVNTAYHQELNVIRNQIFLLWPEKNRNFLQKQKSMLNIIWMKQNCRFSFYSLTKRGIELRERAVMSIK